MAGIKEKQTTFKELEYLLDILEHCRDIKDTNEHHQENNVLEHSVQVFAAACRETQDIDLRLVALFHDIGKMTNYRDHAKPGYNIIKDYVSEKVGWLVLNHMRIKYYLRGEMKRAGKIEELETHPWFIDLIRLQRWDIMGRKPISAKFDKNDIIIKILGITKKSS